MLHGKDIHFEKNEDIYTKSGWIRVDKSLPGWGQRVAVIGYYIKRPDEVVEDWAVLINTCNSYMFWTNEWVATKFVVTHWRASTQ